MKEVFYVFVMQINSEANHGVEMHPVFVRETGKWLEFMTYNSAQLWIQENFALEEHKRFSYQIQKCFIHK